jgi:uridylate kinase
MASSRFHRVVLKLSGEALENSVTGHHIDAEVVARIAGEI